MIIADSRELASRAAIRLRRHHEWLRSLRVDRVVEEWWCACPLAREMIQLVIDLAESALVGLSAPR
jgi:hypothetical protein